MNTRLKEKGFTLIEILTAIIILGIIMIIAVPSVSRYILGSRESAFVTSIEKYIESARNEVTSYEYVVNNPNTTYYIPTKCLATENGEDSPYGKMEESYVVVVVDDKGYYDYYYIGRDETNHGMNLTISDEVDEDHLRDDITSVDITQKIGGRTKIVVYNDDCSKKSTSTADVGEANCGEVTGQSTTWTKDPRTITVACIGNCSKPSYTETFSMTKKEAIVQIADRNNTRTNCRVNVYVDNTVPEVAMKATKKSSNVQVLSDTWSNEGLNFMFAKKTISPSGMTIYYCKDATNACVPDVPVNAGEKITLFNNEQGTFYIRYKVVSGVGLESSVHTYVAKVDSVAPTCELNISGTLSGNGTSYVGDVTIGFESANDTGSGVSEYGLNESSGPHSIVHSESNEEETTYIGYVKDNVGNIGTCSISFTKNSTLTLTYDNQGGTGCTTKKVTYGKTYEELCTPTRVGYTFNGWYSLSSGGTEVTPSTVVTNTSNHSIYARWTANTYTISYTNNGGTLGSNSPTTGTYDAVVSLSAPTKKVTITGNANGTGATIGAAVSVTQTFTGWTSTTIGTNALTGTGTTATTAWNGSMTTNPNFKNLRESGTVTMVANWSSNAVTLPTVTKLGHACSWNTKADGSGTTYASGANYTPANNTSTTVNLYAICTANTYTIKYTTNNGTVANGSPTSGTYDALVTIENPSKTIRATGNANGTGATIGSSTTGAQTFAGWTSTTLGSNAKTGTTTSPATAWTGSSTTNKYFKNLKESGEVTLVANWTVKAFNLPTITKPGHSCKWNTKADGTGTAYNSGASYTPAANSATEITVFAQCTANTYTIAYTMNNGTNASGNPTSGTYDALVTLNAPTKTVKVTGDANGTGATIGADTSKAQTFAGWTSTTVGSYAMTGTTTSPATAWTGSSTTNKYFKNLKESGTVTMVANWTGVAFNLPTVTKAGNTCNWNTKADGTGTTYASGASFTPSNNTEATVKLFAQCKNISYTIAYTMNNGTNASGNPTSGTYGALVTINAPTKTVRAVGNANGTGAVIGNTTSKAQTFAGWSSTTVGSNAVTGTSTSPSTAWTGTNTTNKYFKNLRESGTVTMIANWSPVAFNLPTVTKTGSTCKWNTKADGTGTSYNSGSSYTPSANSDTDVNFYAQCTSNSYTIGYTLNGGTNASGNPTSGTYDALVTINAPTKTVTATGKVNGTGATIGADTSKAQTFAGWTSTTMGSNAKTGTTTSPATAWSGASTKNKYFKNLKESGTVTMVANWTGVAFNLPTVTKTGSTCKWNTKADGSGTSYNSGASFTPTNSTGATLTLYAQCSANNYTISYTMHNGTNASGNPTSGTYNALVTINAPTKTVKVTGDANGTGATVGSATSKAQPFSGWTSTTMGSNAVTGTTTSPSTAWDGSSTTNKYFKNLKESGTVTMVANFTRTEFNLPTVAKTGYTCKWNTKEDGSGTNYNSGASYKPAANASTNITMFAQCTANTYTIAYTMNNGTNASGNPTSGTYNALVTITNPTKTITITGDRNGTGATIGAAVSKAQGFSGWTSTTMGSNAKTGTTTSPATAWDGSSTKNKYFKNLKESGTVTMVANWSNVTITLPTVTKTGYTCKWNTNSGGTGTSYSSGGSYTATSGSKTGITLYAICTDNTPPTCGTWSGASTTWVQTRTISVGCSDTGSGCTQDTFSTTINSGTHGQESVTITIKDKSGNTKDCTKTVNVYVDKEAPTCSVTKSNTGTTTGVTTTVNCTAGSGSPCDNSNPAGDTGLKSNKTYTIKDTAGNSTTTNCSVTVTAQNQQMTQTCKTGKRCSSAGCQTYNKVCKGGAGSSSSYATCGSYCHWSVHGGGQYNCDMENRFWCNGTCYNYVGTVQNGTCKTYKQDAAKCGCQTWNTGSWANITGTCTPSTTNTKKITCRVVYK